MIKAGDTIKSKHIPEMELLVENVIPTDDSFIYACREIGYIKMSKWDTDFRLITHESVLIEGQ